ncbi:hypothetical protein Pmar_PMAR028179 [Perkinsus marinus ATCC 50983]|uniref:Uncharacterized protein n=1 Tax=Perkinsus marinus (strain ATCC 50983 / TXsc) TaxID=423536 RepID=C5LB63_PERM5|nr:hypothetical protein Pmar_PMAR028179 [Perkinsus marinus ATCC 50983]EER05991.1 hypothetical protein Pmar_PMAR028179 [Perkinsus marinus ATCC 50983]|eukprot:XP_002774175.1 hypothetical protein Pmar_PMAR028179 [Perkinsus marinus ATCC 50983]
MAGVALAQLKARVKAATLHPALRFGLLSAEYSRRMRNKAISARKLVLSMREALTRLRNWIEFARIFRLDAQSASLLLVPSHNLTTGMHGDGNKSLEFTADTMMEFVRTNHEFYGSACVTTLDPDKASRDCRKSTVTLTVPGNGATRKNVPSRVSSRNSSRRSSDEHKKLPPQGSVTNLKIFAGEIQRGPGEMEGVRESCGHVVCLGRDALLERPARGRIAG